MAQVDFYVVETTDPIARLRIACRLAEKAYDQGQRTTVRVADAREAAQLDDLLWTFSDRSFVPHAVWPQDEAALHGAAVLIATGPLPPTHRDLLINLALDVPPAYTEYSRLLEVIGGDEDQKRAGRNRWRQYREAGLELKSHDVQDRPSA